MSETERLTNILKKVFPKTYKKYAKLRLNTPKDAKTD